MRDEAVDKIELRKIKGEQGLSKRMREWYPFVVPADDLRAHLIARKHGDLAQELEVRSWARRNH